MSQVGVTASAVTIPARDGYPLGATLHLLGSYFTGAPRERWQIAPSATTGRVGHAGFFREKHRDTLWPRIIDWLLQRAAAAA